MGDLNYKIRKWIIPGKKCLVDLRRGDTLLITFSGFLVKNNYVMSLYPYNRHSYASDFPDKPHEISIYAIRNQNA